MDQFRRVAPPAEDRDHHESPRSSTFSPPSIIRDSSSSAFSKPILPSSSSLLSPKPHFGSPPAPSNGAGAAAIGSGAEPLTTSPARYRECLRNHAASLGGHVVDGCGEFMPLGPADPLKCAACGCHRSFHRREAAVDSSPRAVPLLLPPGPHTSPNPLMRLSGNTTDQSSSEERNTVNTYGNTNNNNVCNYDRSSNYKEYGEGRKKRFRTKFSSDQKEKMRAFAERVGWRVQKKDEGEMERFCSEIGVSRQVLKVWMHNNKHLVRRQLDQQQQQQQQHNESSEAKIHGLQFEQQQHHHDGVV